MVLKHQWLRIDLNPIVKEVNIFIDWDRNIIFIDMGIPTTS